MEISSEITSIEIKHTDMGNPPIRFLAVRLTTQDRKNILTQSPWMVLSAPLAEQVVQAMRKSLDEPQTPVTSTTTAH